MMESHSCWSLPPLEELLLAGAAAAEEVRSLGGRRLARRLPMSWRAPVRHCWFSPLLELLRAGAAAAEEEARALRRLARRLLAS